MSAVRMPTLSVWRSASSVPGGRASKASFVGANTVSGPSPSSTSTSPAASTAARSVENLASDETTSTIDGSGSTMDGIPDPAPSAGAQLSQLLLHRSRTGPPPSTLSHLLARTAGRPVAR